jgi:hypothetical protein
MAFSCNSSLVSNGGSTIVVIVIWIILRAKQTSLLDNTPLAQPQEILMLKRGKVMSNLILVRPIYCSIYIFCFNTMKEMREFLHFKQYVII